MTLTIDLQPEVERGLLARAQAKGVSLADFAQEILTREVEPQIDPKLEGFRPPQPDNLFDLFGPVRGLLTDAEVDHYFARTPSVSRPVDWE